MDIAASLVLLNLVAASPQETNALLHSAEVRQAQSWRPVHDRVMGGVSDGTVETTDSGVGFSGRMSLENNGGFASFRRSVAWPDLGEWDGLRLRVRGDGQTYKLRLRTRGPWAGVSWQAPFATRAGEWVGVDVAFDDLVPSWRGRLVADTGAIDLGSVSEVGFAIADEQDGLFELELASVAAWRTGGEESDPASIRRERTRVLAERLDAGVHGNELAEQMRWNERVLVVASPRGLDAGSSLQVGRFLAARAGLVDRELRVVRLLGNEAGRMAGRTLDGRTTRTLRERWDLDDRSWSVALIGKDGGVKERWSKLVEPESVFELIDRMPMRRSELEARERDGAGE